jgi:hypothetical protein
MAERPTAVNGGGGGGGGVAAAPASAPSSVDVTNFSGIGDASTTATSSSSALAPPGQTLTGKHEHCQFSSFQSHRGASPSFFLFVMRSSKLTLPDLKRELLGEQAKWEISELNSPTALRRFGAPFRSDVGEVSPLDSSLPILRYIFVHHVREFPFLDKAKEKEFWQDKLQVVCVIPFIPFIFTDIYYLL